MNVTEVWSSSCTATPVSAWLTAGIGTGTTWNAQPGLISKTNTQTVAKGNSASCPAGTVGFDMGSSMGRLTTSPQWTIGLRADNESDSLGWKRFDNNASMVVTYDTPPNTPQINWIQNANWVGTPWAAGSKYTTRISAPVYDVWASDPDGTVGGNITVTMTVTTTAGAVLFSGTTAPGIPNNTYQDFTWQGGSLADGDYILKAYTTDAQGIRSTGTMSFAFSVDTTAPAPPVIAAPAAFDSTHNDPNGTPGLPYTFTLKAGSSIGTQGFIYAVAATDTTPTYPATATCDDRQETYVVVCAPNRSSVDITIAATEDSTTLTVWAFDTTGNVSHQVETQPVSYDFTVGKQVDLPTAAAPVTTTGTAAWQAVNVDPTGAPAANGCTGATPTPDSTPHYALELSAGGDRATTATGAVDTSQSFSTSAWICPKSVASAQDVLTQLAATGTNGGPAAELGVGINGAGTGVAVFVGWVSSTANDYVPSKAALPAGQWSFVTAVYDKVNRQMRLSVSNDAFTGTWVIATAAASHISSNPATTQVVIGDQGMPGRSQFIGQVYHPVMLQGVLASEQFTGAGFMFDTDMGVLKK